MAARLALSALLLVLTAFCLSEALRGPGPKKCCFNFNTRPVPEKRVVGYAMTHQSCTKHAVLLKMKTGLELCANPSESWVKELIRHLDSRASA